MLISQLYFLKRFNFVNRFSVIYPTPQSEIVSINIRKISVVITLHIYGLLIILSYLGLTDHSVTGVQHGEYTSMFKATSSPDPMDNCNTITTLQPHQSSAGSRYDTSYPSTGSNGGSYWPPAAASHPLSYPNYYTGNSSSASATTSNPQNSYLNPPMVLYPSSLYSTVNQNQIHLHLHHNDIKPIEQYGEDVTAIVGGNNVTISSGGSRGIEIGILPHNQGGDEVISRYNERQHGDPSVWRPY